MNAIFRNAILKNAIFRNAIFRKPSTYPYDIFFSLIYRSSSFERDGYNESNNEDKNYYEFFI